ncbi:MAG: UPF0146 family protein [Halobacteriales archaeon]
MEEITDYLDDEHDEPIVEVGVGGHPDVSLELHRRGLDVRCTDVVPRKTPDELEFHVDDVREPTLELYRDAETLLSIRPPYELHEPLRALAEEVDASLVVAPLPGEEPPWGELVSRERRALYVYRPDGERR